MQAARLHPAPRREAPVLCSPDTGDPPRTLARTRQATRQGGLPAGHSRDGVDHVQAHLHAAVGMVGLGLREARHAVVAVSQDLDAAAVVLLQTRGQRAS